MSLAHALFLYRTATPIEVGRTLEGAGAVRRMDAYDAVWEVVLESGDKLVFDVGSGYGMFDLTWEELELTWQPLMTLLGGEPRVSGWAQYPDTEEGKAALGDMIKALLDAHDAVVSLGDFKVWTSDVVREPLGIDPRRRV